MKKGTQKIKVYELDFGDTNLISSNKQDTLDWIAADLDNINPDGLEYVITTRSMSQREYNSLPEWS